jgi:hypothetical protein
MTDALACLRARLAELDARAEKRAARDAERAEAIDSPRRREQPAADQPAPARRSAHRRAGAGGEAEGGWETLAEDAQLATRPQRTYPGPAVAPEFRGRDPDQFEIETSAEPETAPAVQASHVGAESSPSPPPAMQAAAGPAATSPAFPPRRPMAAVRDPLAALKARWAAVLQRAVARLAPSWPLRGPWDALVAPTPPEPRPAAVRATGPP